ncbi:MAG: hypothetical protein A2X66_05775 [Ignavibacteria bacterium GWA2_54_16]|nr:MAG: hypothetical protein A2X66_05775 [Ignavibacteria bacterium GWA2_54_16]
MLIPSDIAGPFPHRNFGLRGENYQVHFDFGKFFPLLRIPPRSGIQERDFPPFFFQKEMGNLALATQVSRLRKYLTLLRSTKSRLPFVPFLILRDGEK